MAKKLLSHEPEQYLWQYCQCPKRTGGQGTARGAVMQQQLGASPFLLFVCEEGTRGCDCSASADPKEGLNSWSRVLGQEEAAPGPAELSIPPPTAHCRASPLLGWLLAGWKVLTRSLATGQCCWQWGSMKGISNTVLNIQVHSFVLVFLSPVSDL